MNHTSIKCWIIPQNTVHQSESYLHVVEDEEERIGVELIEEFRWVQHRRRCEWVIRRCRTRIARKIRSAHNDDIIQYHHCYIPVKFSHTCYQALNPELIRHMRLSSVETDQPEFKLATFQITSEWFTVMLCHTMCTLTVPILNTELNLIPHTLTGVSPSRTGAEDADTRRRALPVELDDPWWEAEGRAARRRTEGWGGLLSSTTAAEAALLGRAGSSSAARWLTTAASVTVAAGYLICLQHTARNNMCKNLVKFSHVVFNLCKRTDRRTDILITILCIRPGVT